LSKNGMLPNRGLAEKGHGTKQGGKTTMVLLTQKKEHRVQGGKKKDLWVVREKGRAANMKN